MTIVQKERKPGLDQPVVEKEVTFEENIHFEEFPVINESEKILVLVDEAHRSHTRALHRNLRKALPNAAIIGFTGTPILSKEKTETREIFAEFIDKYILQDAELDGATVPILYEGRTADGFVKDAPGLDELFVDMFRDYTANELAVIKAKYATEGDVLEAPMLVEQKARDMLRHYINVVFPEGFKAQVVATSRDAAFIYGEKLKQARLDLLSELEAVPAANLALSEEEVESSMKTVVFLFVSILCSRKFALWRLRWFSPATITIPSLGGNGPIKPSRKNALSGSSENLPSRKQKRPIRCRF